MGLLPLIPANNWNNTLELNSKKNWETGFATLNFATTFNQQNVVTKQSNGYTLVNLGLGWNEISKTAFDVNLNGIIYLIKIYCLSRLKNDGIPNIGLVLGVNFNL
jgi:hypothetical protein